MSFLVVLGMHRCGTSALTGTLNLLGFSAGSQLTPPDTFNARGYFEDIPLNRELDHFLSAINRSWNDERPYPNDWLSSDAALATAKKLEALFRDDFDFSQRTVLKNPRFSRLLPLLQPIWLGTGLTPKYVLSLRSPLAVIQSLARRDSILPQRAALLYVAHMLEAELNTRNQPRAFVEYDALLHDWRKVVEQIGSKLTADVLSSWQSDSVRSATIDAFLTTELNHFSDEQPRPSGPAIDLALEVYDLLRAPQDDSTLSALDAVRLRWCNYLSSLEPWLSETVRMEQITNNLTSAYITPSKELVLLHSLNAISEMFWACDGEEFTQARKVLAGWSFSQRNCQRFIIPTLTQPLRALRWDITDRPAFCIIKKIWLEDILGEVHWVAELNTSLFTQNGAESNVVAEKDNGYLQILALGFDPSCVLSIPEAVLSRIQPGWAMCTDWEAKLPVEGLPTVMKQFGIAQRQLTQMKAALDQLYVSFEQRLEDPVLAESQLALLKGLLLTDKEIDGKV
ncbi:hypothetical protein KZZ10_10200 [Alcaligenaceae bacterium LF4-65]|uniref:Sulfotransferase family protein n=1 Tax=Zwartia hollandica TaxID=324606 RepID=A0A953ND37_9BURK|nr:hypothetical protein [Zwartia hollandica]MBZ1351016.1 hypothetical protein [Zwartia hollandica]